MATRKKVWNPTVPEGTRNPFDDITTRKTDQYLIVDEIDGNRVRVVISPWPSVDSNNRLVFPVSGSESEKLLDDPSDSELFFDGSALHAMVTRERTSRQQPAADRPLRVGDAFWFRPSRDWVRSVGVEMKGDIIDVTFAARGEAKAAMAWAVTGSSAAPADLMTAGAELDDEKEQFEDGEVEEEEPEPQAQVPPQATDEPARPSVAGSVASPSV